MTMNWEALIGRLVHPTQLAIIEAVRWIERPLSPVQLVRVFDHEIALTSVAYHVGRLADLGVLTPSGTRQVRGATEHFFRLAIAEK
jgi:hypothetical protein